jgi:hypothetical protein
MGNQYTSYATNSPKTVIVGDVVPAKPKAEPVAEKETEVTQETSSHEPAGMELGTHAYLMGEGESLVNNGDSKDVEVQETKEISDNSILIKMKSFTLLIAATAFIIAGCAAYFSVSGLATLFAGAFWSIVVMGGILEVGKLVATSFLYRYWKQTSFFLKTYLMTAIFVLMVITSAGIFGYLSRAHIEQQGNITDAEVVVQRIDSQIEREQSKISNLNERIGDLKSNDIDYSDSIKRQESIRDSAWDIVQNDIDFEQSQINDIQSILREQLESLDKKYELDIQDLNAEQDRIENELQLIAEQEKGLFSSKQTDLKQSLRNQQSEIIDKKDDLRAKLGIDKQELRDDANSRITVHQDRIAQYRSRAQETIDGANNRINDLRDEEELAGSSNTDKVSELQAEIDTIYTTIDGLNDEKFDAEAKVRLVESEVGPVKYVAEAIYGDTEKSTLEKAVRMLIIMIVFVFDPLAVALVLAYNSLVMMGRKIAQPVSVEMSDKKVSKPKTKKEEHKRGLFAKFGKVKTRSGKIKSFEDKDLAETDIK